MRYPQALLGLLCDGQLHSGTELSVALKVTRAAISKQARALGDLGLEVTAVRGRGYRLGAPLQLLDPAKIRAALSADERARLRELEVVPITVSTNSTLLERAAPPPPLCDVLFAEYQTGGRGRRGRAWVAPFASAVLVSLSLSYPESRSDLSGVTLSVGVALLRALKRAGLASLSLKWPNDVEAGGAKLAGVLCELKLEASGPAHVVIGVGLNVALPDTSIEAIALGGRRVTDICRLMPDPPSRSELAALLIEEIMRALFEFGRTGLASFIGEWRGADALFERAVSVECGGSVRTGIARGLSGDGALLVDYEGRIERVDAGDVTLRAVS